MDQLRQTFKAIYKVAMILVTALLTVGAAAAWWYSTPANQLMLVAGIIAILALIVGLSINKLEWQDEQADTLRSVVDDFRDKFPVSLGTGENGQMRWGINKDATVTIDYAEPDVHRVDAALLAEAREMAALGEPIDDICRRIDPAFDDHGDMHRQVFRRMVAAMVQ